ncbi:MAG: hypothetical protein GXY36_18365 [Chloroflexi bacterium]|jgi:hypothetical protein|nr:hypothetical protein [Chloroflexota bacterium]
MLRLQWLGLVLVLGMALVLAACGGDDEPSPTPTNTESPPENSTLAPARLDLQRDYERLRAAHTALAAVWEGLAAGEQVQCGDDLTPPGPENIAGGDPDQAELAGLLRRAAIDLDEAARLWQSECRNPRQNIDPQTINRGLLAVRSAGDALAEAETLLAD